MKAYPSKTQSNITGLTVSNTKTGKKAQPAAGWADYRGEAAQASEWQDLADNSPRLKQAAQLQQMAKAAAPPPVSKSANKFTSNTSRGNHTELSDQLKGGIYAQSGLSINPEVHLNSSKPAELNAHAYAQGNSIYVASGQEKHIPHEAWHVVQQMQGRVKPIVQLNGHGVNDDSKLENEADVMGAKAIQLYDYLSRGKVHERSLQEEKLNFSKKKPQFVPLNDAAVQCGKPRAKVADTRPENGLDVMPTLGFNEYSDHVALRTTVFFMTVLKARMAVEVAGQKPSPALFTDHAAAQTGMGMRHYAKQSIHGIPVHGTDKIDAAHRMNTTLVTSNAISLGMSSAFAIELRDTSAGTSQQFQASNIAADKVIDKFQTNAKNKMLSDNKKTDGVFLMTYLKSYLESCEIALSAKAIKYQHVLVDPSDSNYLKAKSYEVAYLVIQGQLNNINTVANEIVTELRAASFNIS